MKRYGFVFLFLSVFFQTQAQTIQDLEKSRVFIQTIQYMKDGNAYKANLIVSSFPDDSVSAMNHSLWFLADARAGNQLLGISSQDNTNLPIGVYGVKVSPDSKYVAVLQVGEGHPWIDIVDAQLLISTRKYEVLHTLNPYPGSIDLLKWVGEKLLIASDMPLTDLNTKESLDIEKQTEKFNKFLFDPKLKKYSKN